MTFSPVQRQPIFRTTCLKGNSNPILGIHIDLFMCVWHSSGNITSDEYFSLTDRDQSLQGAPKAMLGLTTSATSWERDPQADFVKDVSRLITRSDLGGFVEST